MTFSSYDLILSICRAHIARWCAESNRPLKIVDDREFEILMKAGRPGVSIPSQRTVSRDIQSAFEKCRLRIDRILRVRVSIPLVLLMA